MPLTRPLQDAGSDKVLIIDDEEGIRRVLRIILQQMGYAVLCAADGKEGLALFETESPSIVITDIRMPEVDGIQVLKSVKERTDEAEVIVVTGHGEMDLAIEALKLQASDFIHKPISNDALLLAVDRARDRISIRRELRGYTEELERKVQEATAELRRANAFQENLIQSSIDGIVGTDREGTIVVFNRSAQRLSRYSQEEVVGVKQISHLFGEETGALMMEVLGGRGSPGEPSGIAHRDTHLVARDGTPVPIRLSGAPLREDERIVGSVWSVEDLSEVRALERRLIESERLAAMGETVAGMAHAVKNVLGGLTGGGYVLEKGLELGREDLTRQGWGMVQRNVSKIRELVMDLLSYAKERDPERALCDPNEVATEAAETMRAMAAEYGVEILDEDDKTLPPWLMDRKWMHRCLANLLSNAVDACSEPFGLGRPGKVVLRRYTAPSGELCFEVSDNGCGMEEEVRRRIFTTFFSTKGAKGTGLGLMLTQKMVREHGGRMEVESEPGKGSTFRICLPPLTDISVSQNPKEERRN